MDTTETRWQRHVDAGRRYVSEGDYAQAEQALLAAVKEALTFGPADLRVASSLGILGKLKHQQGQRERAEALLRRALAIREQALGPDHYGLVQSLSDLGLLYYDAGQLDQAEALFARALAISERQLAPDHGDLAVALYNLARVYFKSGTPVRAEPLLMRLLAQKERTLGPEHPDVAAILTALARVRSITGHHDEGEAMARRALAIRERTLSPNDPAIAVGLDLVAYFCAGRAKREQLAAEAEHILHGWQGGREEAALQATIDALLAEERELRERARAIRAQTGNRTEPSTLERQPASVTVDTSPASIAAARPALAAPPVAAAPSSVISPSSSTDDSSDNAAQSSPAAESAAAPVDAVATGDEVSTDPPIAPDAASSSNSAMALVTVAPVAPVVMMNADQMAAPIPPRRSRRTYALIAAVVLAMLSSGIIGLLIGRSQRVNGGAVTSHADSSALEMQATAGSLRSPDEVAAERRAVAHPTARPPRQIKIVSAPETPPDAPSARESVRLPSTNHMRRLDALMNRASARATQGFKVRADSLARRVELHAPKFEDRPVDPNPDP
jgi:tetratricopeptide (TPR) repeat protein